MDTALFAYVKVNALGAGRITQVKRDAEIAKAEASKETTIKTAQAFQEGEKARLLAGTQIAESAKEKELKVQEFRREQE